MGLSSLPEFTLTCKGRRRKPYCSFSSFKQAALQASETQRKWVSENLVNKLRNQPDCRYVGILLEFQKGITLDVLKEYSVQLLFQRQLHSQEPRAGYAFSHKPDHRT